MTHQPASDLGIKPARLSAGKQDGKQNHPLHKELQALLEDTHRQQKIATFEQTHRLPALRPLTTAPHAREIRYLLTSESGSILIEAARKITYPPLWYALAGLDRPDS